MILFDLYIRTIDFVIGLVEEDFDDGLFDIIKRLIWWKNQEKIFDKEDDDMLGSKRKQKPGISFVCWRNFIIFQSKDVTTSNNKSQKLWNFKGKFE